MYRQNNAAEYLEILAHQAGSLALSQRYAAEADRLRLKERSSSATFPVHFFRNSFLHF
jgi:hypothetical protein